MGMEDYSDSNTLYTILRTKLLDNDLLEIFADIAALAPGGIHWLRMWASTAGSR